MISWIDNFTVVGLVTWPLNGNEVGGNLALIQTSMLLLCKSSCSYAMLFTWEKQRGLYQNKVTSNLACIYGQVTKHTTVKWPIIKTEVCVICRCRRLGHITQTRGFDNSWYHAKTEFNNCFIIHFLHNSSSETEAKPSAILFLRRTL